MFYTGTVVEGQFSQHRSSSFGSIAALSSSAIPISLTRILPVGSKENYILMVIYGFPKHPYVMHMFELISFSLFPFIPCGEYIHISSSEMTNRLLFNSSRLGLNIIDGKINKFSSQIFSG